MTTRNMHLVSSKVTLSPIEEKDKANMLKMAQSELIAKTYMLPIFSNEEQKEAFFLRLKSLSIDPSRFVYGIHRNEDKALVGFLNEVEKINEEIEVGYFVDEDNWGRGYATDALSLAIEELFHLGYKKVKAAHFEGNEASAKVMRKAGMKKSEEDSDVEYRGKIYHCIGYEIINPAILTK